MATDWKSRYTPKLFVCLREGYSLRQYFGDSAAGLTVAIIALPLFEFTRAGFDERLGLENIFDNLEDAMARAREILSPAAAPPLPTTPVA